MRKASAPNKPQKKAGRAIHAAPPTDDWSKLSQREKFTRTARELGCDESGEEFERAFSRVFPPRKPGEPAPSYAAAEPSTGSRRKPREPDQPTNPHSEEFDNP